MNLRQRKKRYMKHYQKYRNPSKRCGYPWEPGPVGYCWGYATKIDEGKTPKEITKTLCPGCEMFQGKR